MAIHITKVYTRSGDDGKTGLVGGERVDKDHLRLLAYGALDELNGYLGMARTVILEHPRLPPLDKQVLDTELRQIQNRIFDAGSILATPADSTWAGMPVFQEEDAKGLEVSMDKMQAHLPSLRSFVLPGGDGANAWLHLARTVCRRAERDIVTLNRETRVDAPLRHYVNRLSDWLFVASRHVSRLAEVPEFLWEYALKEKKAEPEDTKPQP